MKWCVLLALAAGLLVAADAPKEPATKGGAEDKLIALEKQTLVALKKKDADAIKRLTADDFQGVLPSGTMDKEQAAAVLADLTVDDYTIESAKVLMITRDVGVVRYRLKMKGSYKGKAFPETPAYVSSTW